MRSAQLRIDKELVTEQMEVANGNSQCRKEKGTIFPPLLNIQSKVMENLDPFAVRIMPPWKNGHGETE